MNIPDGIESGTPVRLEDEKGVFLALGYFSSYSQIAVRLWGYEADEKIDRDFFLRRIKRAIESRRRYVETPETDSYRVINGENDFLPGLIVDKYADCLSIQCHTQGIELWKPMIVDALIEAMNPAGIYERSDVSVRNRDGVEERTGLLHGDVPDTVEILENGFKFIVDIKRGQKTGFYLDQRDKRKAIMKYSKDACVLNCFSYTGGFSVYALAGGATRVRSVDVSGDALALARENVKINGLDESRCEFVDLDVKKYLREANSGEFGVIVLDPPAFIKDRKKKPEGISGYRSINDGALRLLPKEGGVLVTCSCSAHITLQEFRYMLSECGGNVSRSMQVLETFTHGPDHPVLVPFLEGEYLKCLYLSVA